MKFKHIQFLVFFFVKTAHQITCTLWYKLSYLTKTIKFIHVKDFVSIATIFLKQAVFQNHLAIMINL